MSRTPLFLALAALAVQLTAAPAGAQEYIWSADRPDGVAPAGIFGDRVLPVGVAEVKPWYRSFDHEGTRFGSDFIGFNELLSTFELVPFAMSTDVVGVDVAFGAVEDLTVLVRLAYASLQRDLVDEDINVFTLESSGVTDIEAHALWEVYRQGAWRAHLQGGLSVPTGSVDAEDDEATFRSGPLPYDMQLGAGVLGVIPGATIQAMNEVGSVGLQLLGRVYLGENDRGWRPGNSTHLNGWAAYRLNRFFSVSSGVRASAFNAIEGFDPDLQPFRDPGEFPASFGGERVDIPLGLNLRIPEGKLAGHRVSLEFLFNAHEDLEGPWLAADDGFMIAWTAVF